MEPNKFFAFSQHNMQKYCMTTFNVFAYFYTWASCCQMSFYMPYLVQPASLILKCVGLKYKSSCIKTFMI